VTDASLAAFGKVNLCLYLGPVRADGRHELVTVFESVDLADQLTIGVAESDEVVCRGVTGPNLAADALVALRAVGWDAPPVRIEIEKHIPVAAGMGGGSADAAAVLRFASTVAPVSWEDMWQIAARLGADVPSQLDPGPSLGTGAGEVIESLRPLPEHAVVVVPQAFGLSTADVYREADRLGLPRSANDLAERMADLQRALARGRPIPADNDLGPAALSLRPEIGAALEAVVDAGADEGLVCGSGPTVIGVCWGTDCAARAQEAAGRLRVRWRGSAAVNTVERGGRPLT
jgi:4-diphosphocytidyl-2-C-methyl-D-erythritol kinase